MTHTRYSYLTDEELLRLADSGEALPMEFAREMASRLSASLEREEDLAEEIRLEMMGNGNDKG